MTHGAKAVVKFADEWVEGAVPTAFSDHYPRLKASLAASLKPILAAAEQRGLERAAKIAEDYPSLCMDCTDTVKVANEIRSALRENGSIKKPPPRLEDRSGGLMVLVVVVPTFARIGRVEVGRSVVGVSQGDTLALLQIFREVLFAARKAACAGRGEVEGNFSFTPQRTGESFGAHLDPSAFWMAARSNLHGHVGISQFSFSHFGAYWTRIAASSSSGAAAIRRALAFHTSSSMFSG